MCVCVCVCVCVCSNIRANTEFGRGRSASPAVTLSEPTGRLLAVVRRNASTVPHRVRSAFH